jgi:uncharacterized membrane protein SpoIIM required for sporulation
MGVGFRTFASGIFFGLGSLFFLLYNGVMLGAVTGHMLHMGYGVTFSSFVIGHGAFELQAVVLAGAAGLRMGWSLIAPGPYKRSDALKMGARAAVLLVFGSTGLFLVAAVVEAFWSASVSIPVAVKYVAGGLLWLLVTLYFSLARRVHGS